MKLFNFVRIIRVIMVLGPFYLTTNTASHVMSVRSKAGGSECCGCKILALQPYEISGFS